MRTLTRNIPWLVSLALFAACAVFATGDSIVRADEAPSDAARDGSTLRVITYNVQFLPGIAAAANERKEPRYRAEVLGRTLSAFDVVGLNEVFDLPMRKVLLSQFEKAWGDAYHVVQCPKPPEGKLMDGGLAIVSRLPILQSHSMVYSQGSSIAKYGVRADGFAAKGALHARIARHENPGPGEVFDVFVTHLESKDQPIRDVQYRELAEFVREHSDPAIPALLLGDFNTRGNPQYQEDPDSPYHVMLKALASARPAAALVDLWVEIGEGEGGTSEQTIPPSGRRIDYIFMLSPEGDRPALLPKKIRVNPYLDARVVALSDHSAVEADFAWPTAAE